jgi:Protein of unknown function (DUF 659)
VEEYLEKQDNLYISFDESNDVANNRIMNISITIKRGAFYYKNIDLDAITVSAELCAEKIKQQARSITNGQLKRINSISTDTCDTILKTTRLLQAFPSFQHIFMVPCDPYGLQLLIQDICESSAFRQTIKQADEIVSHFKSAKKQYQILKQLQREFCPNRRGKAYALILRCKIRWGSYSGEF